MSEERGDSIVADGDLKEALAEYRQASERSMIKETKDRCLGKVEDLEFIIAIHESRQERERREKIELEAVIIRSLEEFEEELIKKLYDNLINKSDAIGYISEFKDLRKELSSLVDKNPDKPEIIYRWLANELRISRLEKIAELKKVSNSEDVQSLLSDLITLIEN